MKRIANQESFVRQADPGLAHPAIADEIKILEEQLNKLPATLRSMYEICTPKKVFLMAWLKKIMSFFFKNEDIHLPDIFPANLKKTTRGQYSMSFNPKGIIQINSDLSLAATLETILHELCHHIVNTKAVIEGHPNKLHHPISFRDKLAGFGILVNQKGCHMLASLQSFRSCTKKEAEETFGSAYYRKTTEKEDKVSPQPNFLFFLEELGIEYIPEPIPVVVVTKKINWKKVAEEGLEKVKELEIQVEELKKQVFFHFQEATQEPQQEATQEPQQEATQEKEIALLEPIVFSVLSLDKKTTLNNFYAKTNLELRKRNASETFFRKEKIKQALGVLIQKGLVCEEYHNRLGKRYWIAKI